MRVLLAWAAAGGGAGRVMSALTAGLQRAGCDVLTVTPQPSGLDAPGIVTGSRAPHRVVGGIAGALRRFDPDVLISGQQQMNVAALLAAKLARSRARKVVIQHNRLSELAAADRRLRFMPTVARQIYPLADSVVAVSRGVADDLAAIGVRATVVHNGIPLETIERMALEDPGDLWFAAGQPPVILAAGRLVEQKDYPTLFDAFRLLRARRRVRLLVLGEGPLRPDLAEMLLDLEPDWHHDIDLFGHVDNPYSRMARVACLALSSKFEGFGLVLAEAMACGCPVVSTDCLSGPGEILDGGRFGPLVPVGDAAALADAISRVLDGAHPSSADLRRRAAEFSEQAMVRRYRELLESAAARSPSWSWPGVCRS